MITDETELIIPGYDPSDPQPYPGDIKPDYYSQAKIKKLLKKYQNDFESLHFLRDMMEE
jgi:hypothetical protein